MARKTQWRQCLILIAPCNAQRRCESGCLHFVILLNPSWGTARFSLVERHESLPLLSTRRRWWAGRPYNLSVLVYREINLEVLIQPINDFPLMWSWTAGTPTSWDFPETFLSQPTLLVMLWELDFYNEGQPRGSKLISCTLWLCIGIDTHPNWALVLAVMIYLHLSNAFSSSCNHFHLRKARDIKTELRHAYFFSERTKLIITTSPARTLKSKPNLYFA